MRKAWISQFQTFKQQEVRFSTLQSQHFISSVESKVKIVVGTFCFHTHAHSHTDTPFTSAIPASNSKQIITSLTMGGVIFVSSFVSFHII